MSNTNQKSGKNEKVFDFVKVELNEKSDNTGPSCIVRFKGISFVMNRSNMEIVSDFIRRFIYD